MRRPVHGFHVLTIAWLASHEATVRTDCACEPMTVTPIPREQLPQPEPTNDVAALPPGRPTPAGSASTVLSARSAGPGGLLEDNSAFQVFRLR